MRNEASKVIKVKTFEEGKNKWITIEKKKSLK